MTAQQLKNAILQEAIQGRLVPQDPNDEPASALLAKIREEKKRLVKEGKLKKKDLEEKPISEDEIPFEIPESWEWVRWGELGEYKKGPFGSSLTKSMFVPQSNETVKVYEQKNAIQKNYSLGDYYITKEKFKTMTGFTVRPGDIIVSCAGTIGETYLLPPEAPIGIINQALMRAKLHLDSIIPYWLLYFQYVLLIENKLKGSGSAIKNIPPFEILKAMPVPLPPLAEQYRIVAKIEELLPKVEEYGTAQEKLNKLNEELPERLKKSILQEAIEGRLVPQDPNDEPAPVLLAKIREEKKRLVKKGILKKKDLEETPVDEEEEPFKIPESWEWCKLGTITSLLGGFAFKSHEYTSIGSRVIRISDITEDGFVEKNVVRYPYNAKLHSYVIQGGDILMAMTGGTVGKSLYVKALPEEKMLLNQRVANIRTILIFTDYIDYVIKSQHIQSIITDAKNSTNDNISMVDIYNFPIPLPPLAEQHRIVEKIEQLFKEIDKLKK